MKHPRLRQPVRPRDMHEQQQRLLLTWVFPPDSKPKAWELCFQVIFFFPSSQSIRCFPQVPLEATDCLSVLQHVGSSDG